MPRRIVGLASLASASDERVQALARVLAERGDRVVWFVPGEPLASLANAEPVLRLASRVLLRRTEATAAPPTDGVAPGRIEQVSVGPPIGAQPRLREVVGYAARLGVQVALRSARNRFHAFVVHGGEEAVALLGATARLVGARVILDLDTRRADLAQGLVAAAAALGRTSALRLVDGVVASDPAAARRLRGLGLEAATIDLGPDPEDFARRPTQPRITVKTPVRVMLRSAEGPSDPALLAAFAYALDGEPRFEAELLGATRAEADAFAEQTGATVRPCAARPPEVWRAAVEDVHLALVVGADPGAVLPLLAVGIPVVALGGRGLESLLSGDEGCIVATHSAEEAGEALLRLRRSSRDRRELIKRGWAWVEGEGATSRHARLFEVIDGKTPSP